MTFYWKHPPSLMKKRRDIWHSAHVCFVLRISSNPGIISNYFETSAVGVRPSESKSEGSAPDPNMLNNSNGEKPVMKEAEIHEIRGGCFVWCVKVQGWCIITSAQIFLITLFTPLLIACPHMLRCMNISDSVSLQHETAVFLRLLYGTSHSWELSVKTITTTKAATSRVKNWG